MASRGQTSKTNKTQEPQVNPQGARIDEYMITRSKNVTEKDSTSNMGKESAMTPEFVSDMKIFITDTLKTHTLEILNKMENIKEEITVLNNKLEETLKTGEFNSGEIQDNKTNIEKLRKEFEDYRSEMNRKFLQQEMYSRKINRLVYRVPDSENPVEATTELFKSMGITHHIDFVNIHRLPSYSTTERSAQQPKPIVITFVKMCDRQSVLDASYKNRELLRRKKMSVRTDLPVVLKKERGKLAEKAYDLRKKLGYQTKILERGLDLVLQYRHDYDSPWKSIGLQDSLDYL